MDKTNEILRFGRTSLACRIDVLIREVKDLVVEAWHSPEALQSLKTQSNVRTRVDLSLDPSLFKQLQADEASSCIKDLCSWMLSLSVEYTVGYTPLLGVHSGRSSGHFIAVEIFRDER